MRSSLFKPVIMPGWPRRVVRNLSPELRRLKTRGLELAAVSTEAQQLGQDRDRGLVLTCNPDPGLSLSSSRTLESLYRCQSVTATSQPRTFHQTQERWWKIGSERERESQRQHNDFHLGPATPGLAWAGFKLIQIRIKNKLNERHKHYLMPSLQILSWCRYFLSTTQSSLGPRCF